MAQQTEPNYQPALTLKLFMQGKEVGSIIGKKGDNIKRIREVSGAKINVSDSSCPDRIVTLTGCLEEVHNAFSMICMKFEEQMSETNTASGSAINNSTTGLSLSSNNNPKSPSSVIDSLFGLPSSGILNDALKDGKIGVKDTDMLTINNNSTSTINNNNINAPNKNLTQTISSKPVSTSINANSNSYHPIVTLRLIIPASQCGSLIGRGGAKIKEIREQTGAMIQIGADVLPNSSERVVTISGTVESLRNCANQICTIMIESPPKGFTIPYRPKPALNPMLLAAAASSQAAAAYNLPGQFALPTHPDVNRLFVANSTMAAFAPTPANLRAAAATGQAAAAAAAAASLSASQPHEMVIPNGLIGCVIGKAGSKINEIRQLSGATIKISNSEEGTKNRTVTISGPPEAVSLAQYLITAR